jgi:hypothetical protein
MLAIAAAAFGAIVCLRVLRAPTVPSGQRPLLVLDSANLDQVRTAFNEGATHARVIAFLSPT